MPIKVNCLTCGKELLRSPSKVEPRNYCSYGCYSDTRNKELMRKGAPYRITRERYKKLRKKAVEGLKKHSGESHYAWKGDKVSYRGLHYWLRRKLGKPTKCIQCGKVDTRPKFIQWANIDGTYRRVLSDYIPLCTSCHKLYDLSMKSTQGSQIAKRRRS